MIKTISVLFSLIVLITTNPVKEVTEKSQEIVDGAENTKNNGDRDESDPTQVVHRDILKDEKEIKFLNKDDVHEEENYREVLEESNKAALSAKSNIFFDDVISDSSDIILGSSNDKIEEVLIPSPTSFEESNDFTKRQEEIAIVLEDVTEALNHDENKPEDNLAVNEDDMNWRSAENLHSVGKEYSNEETSREDTDRDYNDEDFMDKKIDINIKGRMEPRNPERREHNNNRRPINSRLYGSRDDHRILDAGPKRSFGEIVIPRLRPTLTRNGIVFTPTLFTVQTPSPLLDRLSGHNWVQNRPLMNPDNLFTEQQHSRVISTPQIHYEDSKMIDDYNDYGSNTYSYAPVMKVTTQTSPQQIIAPKKIDVFQKLVDASNHPKTARRTLNDNIYPVNYYPQRQYPESYGQFDVRRPRRDIFDEPFPNI